MHFRPVSQRSFSFDIQYLAFGPRLARLLGFNWKKQYALEQSHIAEDDYDLYGGLSHIQMMSNVVDLSPVGSQWMSVLRVIPMQTYGIRQFVFSPVVFYPVATNRNVELIQQCNHR